MKVRIRKALPHETPSYNSKLSNFLVKAANGMEVQQEQQSQSQSQEADSAQIIDYIKSLFEGGEYFENVVAKFSRDYGIDTDQASDFVKYVQDNYVEDPLLFGDDDDDIKEDEVVDIEEQPVEEPVAYDYNLNEDGVASGDLGDGLDLTEDDQMKFGGSKSKTIKHFKKLLRAAAGTAVEGQDNETSSQPNIRGTIDNPSDPYNNNTNFIGAINNQVKDNFYTKQAEKMYEQQANGQFGFGGNRRIRRANKAFFGTKTAPVGVDTNYKFGLLGNLKEGTIKWDPEMITNMMQQFGTNQAYQGFGYDPGYGGGRWNSSYNTGWKKTTVPGRIVTEKVSKIINSAADPTKVNNVALNNNPAASSNIDIRPGILADLYPNGMPEIKTGAHPTLDPTLDPTLNPTLNPASAQWQSDLERNKVLNAYGSYADYRATPLDTIPSGNIDDPNTPINESLIWSSTTSQDDYNAANKAYELANFDYDALTPEQQNLLQQAYYKTKNSKGEEFSSAAGFGSPEYEDKLNALKSEYEKQEDAYYAGQKAAGFPEEYVEWGQEWLNAQPPQEEDGGFVDPSQMQPGVLQKFFSGGYDDITQEDIDFTNSKNTTGSYRNGGYLRKAQYGQSQSYDDNDVQFANKEAYNAAVANGLTNEEYNPNTTYTGVNSNYNKTNNTNNTDRHTTRNTTTYNNQGFSQGSNQGWYDPRQAAFAIPGRGQGRDGSFRNMMSQFMPVTNDMTWYNQTAGPLGAIKEGYAPSQLKYSKQRKTEGTWAERKLGFNKDRFVDVTYNKLGANDKPGANNKPGVGVYAPGYGANANMKPGSTTALGADGTNGTSYGDYSSFKNSTERKIAKGEKRAAEDEAEGRAAFPEDYVDGPSSPDDNSSQPFSSQEYLAKEYGDIGPEIDLDGTNETYNSLDPLNTKRSNGMSYDGSEDVNTSFDDFMKTNPSKEDIDKEVSQRLSRKNRDLDRNVYPNNYDYNLLSPKAYGGYVPNDYMAYGGYLPEAQFGKVGPFMTNDTDCTDQQKRDPQSPCYDANFAIPAFARPGASIQEMMGIDNINCSEEDKLDPESDCYVDPDPNSITKRFKVNKAKTVNFGAIGAGANLAGNATARVKEVLDNNKLENTDKSKYYTSMGREDMKDTEFRGTTTQMGWDPNAGYESTGRMTTGFGKKGGSVNKEGDITYMSSKQIKEFLKNGGQLEFQ